MKPPLYNHGKMWTHTARCRSKARVIVNKGSILVFQCIYFIPIKKKRAFQRKIFELVNAHLLIPILSSSFPQSDHFPSFFSGSLCCPLNYTSQTWYSLNLIFTTQKGPIQSVSVRRLVQRCNMKEWEY